MRFVLPLALAVASSAWATPVFNIAGASSAGTNTHDLLLFGLGNSLVFQNSVATWPTVFTTCLNLQPGGCKLTYQFHVQQPANASYFVSDGTNTVTDADFPSGFAVGNLVWSASPLHFATPPSAGRTILVPISISGFLRAITPAQRMANQAPFFDYAISAHGFMRARVQKVSGSTISWTSGSAAFAGTAQQTPEPAAWLLALPVLGYIWYRRRNRAA